MVACLVMVSPSSRQILKGGVLGAGVVEGGVCPLLNSRSGAGLGGVALRRLPGQGRDLAYEPWLAGQLRKASVDAGEEGVGTEAIGSVDGVISFACSVYAANVRLLVEVYPEAALGVVQLPGKIFIS